MLLVMGTSLLTFTTSPIVMTDALEYVMKPLEKIKISRTFCWRSDDDNCT